MLRNNIEVLMKSVNYVNSLPTSQVLNTWYEIIHKRPGFISTTIFMDLHCAYSTNTPIYLTLFQSPFTNRESRFVSVNISLFFSQFFLFFRFFVFTGCFSFNFCLICLYLI